MSPLTGVAIGGGALYDAQAAEPEPVVATSTATAEPAKEEESIVKPETAADGAPPAVEVSAKKSDLDSARSNVAQCF